MDLQQDKELLSSETDAWGPGNPRRGVLLTHNTRFQALEQQPAVLQSAKEAQFRNPCKTN